MVYFNEMESDGIVKEWDMNDDASRGKFRACHVLMTLMTPSETLLLNYPVHVSMEGFKRLSPYVSRNCSNSFL